ncbi:MAG: GNAT family N-acetyltransferase [Brevinematales bacterium]|nr:GNAT family N-acetyltransferase [Brevinematales bacterium]
MEPLVKLKGKRCSLALIEQGDFEKIDAWLCNPEMNHLLPSSYRRMFTKSAEEIVTERIKSGEHFFSIRLTLTGEMIGYCWIFGIDHVNRFAYVGILIGNPAYWGKGFGTDAMNLMLDYGFNALNLHNITLWAVGTNERAIRSYEKCGFRIVGRRRECMNIEGKLYDAVYMDILDRDFKGESVLKKYYAE